MVINKYLKDSPEQLAYLETLLNEEKADRFLGYPSGTLQRLRGKGLFRDFTYQGKDIFYSRRSLILWAQGQKKRKKI